MANFDTAYAITQKNEDGYNSNKDGADTGGETALGVSRNNFPNFKGWRIADDYKKIAKNDDEMTTLLKNNPEFMGYVKEWYKAEFWDKLKCDLVPYQELANKLFDIGVNMNWDKAAKFLQIALNCFNRRQKDYADVAIDGLIGAKTLIALEAYMNKRNDLPTLLEAITCQQGHYYIDITLNREANEDFCYGWFKNRVVF